MTPIRFLAAALGVIAALGSADAMAARTREHRHAGHHPRVSTATYTTPARPHARVLRMANTRPVPEARRYAQAPRRHSLMRGS